MSNKVKKGVKKRMKALLLAAHGSRLAASNEEVEALAAAVAVECADQFGQVATAFLELAQPDIPQGIRNCVEAGASSVTIVPYFLAAGTHVVNDIPEIVRQARLDYPNCTIEMVGHIGASERMPQLIRAAASACDA